MTNRPIKRIRIHPAIGIARLGDSPDGFFIGPEIPDVHPHVSKYRDSEFHLKRQGARFRLFAYDAKDAVIGEIDCCDSRVQSIRWTVQLRNTKAAGPRFEGILNQGARLRNERFRRDQLILDAGVHTIIGTDRGRKNSSGLAGLNGRLSKSKRLDMTCSAFMNATLTPPLLLGTLLTDGAGRLVVLGGRGRSNSPIGTKIEEANDPFSFANHDDWYDDASDGYVRAEVVWAPHIKGLPTEALASWVIVAPPKYAPSLQCVVTLYDLLFDKALRDKRPRAWQESDWIRSLLRMPQKPSEARDIRPILRRAHDMKWVFARAAVGHENEIDLSKPIPPNMRQHIFRQFREPSNDPMQPGTGTGRMPYIWSDLFDLNDSEPTKQPVNATLTRHQFEMMRLWASNEMKSDWKATEPTPTTITPHGLDKAALDPCVGAALFPGIETSFHIRDKFKYLEPFRLDPSSIEPGDATQQMSVPWQSDFVDCSDGDSPFAWWPTQRPIDVLVESAGEMKTVRWARGFDGNKGDMATEKMLEDWWRLGLLRSVGRQVIESGRVTGTKSKRAVKA